MPLNAQQQLAVEYLGGPLLVLAGAGSGKTSVITQKMHYLIQTANMPAQNIYAVTFTNKAAREMKHRLEKLGPYSDVHVSTFHTLGLRILRSAGSHTGLGHQFSIFDEQDSLDIIKKIMQKDVDKTQLQSIRQSISNWKNDLLSPEQALASTKTHGMRACAQVYLRYFELMQQFRAVDFDDLIYLPVKLFEQHPEVLQQWQARIRYLLIDEYQDTNSAQYRLVKQLMGVKSAFTVVGDDDQSIYAWRGAKPQNLQLLSEDFPQLNVIMLEQNYRSTTRILRCANHLIAHNEHLFEKSLWSGLGEGDKIAITQLEDESIEANYVVSNLVTRQLQLQCGYDHFAILYRSNTQARHFEHLLRAQKIPYQVSGGTSFFSRQEVKDFMCYLRLLVNPNDDNAFLRIVNVPRRGIGLSTLDKLAGYAKSRNTSLFQAAQELGVAQVLPPLPYQRLKNFVDKILSCAKQCYQNDPICHLQKLLEDIHYADWLLECHKNPLEAQARMDNVRNLLQWLCEDIKKDPKNFVNAVIQLTLQDKTEDDSKKKGVQLMTLHAAKGLEFPTVYLVGFEEELLPHRNANDKDIAEERRLAYVGITRARKSLIITHANSRSRHGRSYLAKPSRFLQELPQEDCLWLDDKTAVNTTSKDEKKSRLQSLKQLLSE